jgi:hypothetical protein
MASEKSGKRRRVVPAWLFTCLKVLVFYPAMVLILCVVLITPLAVAVFQKVIGQILGGFLAGLGTIAALTNSLVILVAYGTWLVLCGDWTRLVCLLPGWLDWLRSAGFL